MFKLGSQTWVFSIGNSGSTNNEFLWVSHGPSMICVHCLYTTKSASVLSLWVCIVIVLYIYIPCVCLCVCQSVCKRTLTMGSSHNCTTYILFLCLSVCLSVNQSVCILSFLLGSVAIIFLCTFLFPCSTQKCWQCYT